MFYFRIFLHPVGKQNVCRKRRRKKKKKKKKGGRNTGCCIFGGKLEEERRRGNSSRVQKKRKYALPPLQAERCRKEKKALFVLLFFPFSLSLCLRERKRRFLLPSMFSPFLLQCRCCCCRSLCVLGGCGGGGMCCFPPSPSPSPSPPIFGNFAVVVVRARQALKIGLHIVFSRRQKNIYFFMKKRQIKNFFCCSVANDLGKNRPFLYCRASTTCLLLCLSLLALLALVFVWVFVAKEGKGGGG